MLLKKVPCGNNIPHDIYIIIEISYGSSYVKYEFNNKFNLISVDRFIKSPLVYPFNYGFINKTLYNDGDCLDVILICNYKLIPGSVINCRPIGLLKMKDESGYDNKILAVPNYCVSNKYDNIQDICDVSKNLLNKIYFFFENYKILDNKKWVKIYDWYDINCAKKCILNSINNFLKLKKDKK